MNIVYSEHAILRMKQRGITSLEVEHVLQYPMYIKKSSEERKEAVGIVGNKAIKIKFIAIENYIKIITVI